MLAQWANEMHFLSPPDADHKSTIAAMETGFRALAGASEQCMIATRCRKLSQTISNKVIGGAFHTIPTLRTRWPMSLICEAWQGPAVRGARVHR
jgi:hypothetical protein